MQLTLGYSDSEDRLWLTTSDGTRFWLTRRMLAGFLPQAAILLTKTVPGGDIPNALTPEQRVGLEHGESLADTPSGSPALQHNVDSRAENPAPPQLATSLTLNVSSDHCQFIVRAAGMESRFPLQRLDLHRLLGAMVLTTRHAGWGLADLPNWLHPEED